MPPTAEMLAELAGENRVFPVVEITLEGNSGTEVLRFAPLAVASESEGVYLPYLVSMGGFSRSADLSLEFSRPTVTIFDQDRTIQKRLGGEFKSRLRGQRVECWRRSFHVDAAAHYRFFSGEIADYGQADRDYTFQFQHTNARLLRRKFKIPRIDRADFPNMPAAFEKTAGRVVIGPHLSVGIPGDSGLTDGESAAGMIQAIPITRNTDGTVPTWVVSLAACHVTNVWVDGVHRANNTWTQRDLQRNSGNLWRIITFTSAAPEADASVTVDTVGVGKTSPRSGADPIERPVKAIEILLRNFAFGDGLTNKDAWDSPAGVFDTTLLAAAEQFYENRLTPIGAVATSDRTALDFLNEWAENFRCNVFFTDAGLLAFAPEDHGEVAIYQDSRLIRQDVGDALGPLGNDTQEKAQITTIGAGHHFREAIGRITMTGSATDPSFDPAFPDETTYNMTGSAGF